MIAALPLILLLGGADGPTVAEPDIVVTGRGLDTDPQARGYDVVILDRDRLTSTASNRLEDALADIAGLQSFRRSDSRSANPTSQGESLRGIGGNAASRALLILDGVPQGDPFAGWIAFPAYANDRLGSIRVVRGGGSGLWGPGALTGTIELTSATPDQLAPISAALAYGSRNAVDASAAATLRNAGGFATLSAQYQRGDGFVPITAQDRGLVDRAAPYEQASVALRGVVAIGGSTELQTTLQGFTDRRDRGLDYTAIKSEGADASVRLVGQGAWRWSLLGYVQTRSFASQFASVNDARTAVVPTLNQYSVPGTGIGARFDIEPPLGAGVTLRLGGDVRALSGRTQELFSYTGLTPTRRREAGGATQTLGGFADLTASLGQLTIDGNARIDHWQITGGHLLEAPLAGAGSTTDTLYADRSGWEPTGRIGAGWRVDDRVTLRAAGYRGWRLPTLNELYRPFRAGADGTAANALLKPERLLGAEAGVDFRPTAHVTVAVTGFINRLDDAIANVTVARGPINCPGVGQVSAAGTCRRRDNLTAIEAKGVEVEASARWGAVDARLSYAYTDARVIGAGASAGLDGLVPAQTPAHQLSTTLAYRPQNGPGGSVTGRYVAAQFEDDQNARTLRSAFTLDATATVPVGKGLSIDARAENVFDATVDTGFSNAALERAHPRTLWIGARFTL